MLCKIRFLIATMMKEVEFKKQSVITEIIDYIKFNNDGGSSLI